MTSQSGPRRLSFEQLESKAAPSSILLLLASGGDSPPEIASSVETAAAPTTAAWRFEHDTQSLLQFIDAHTAATGVETVASHMPTEAECAAADDMMKVDDLDLRAMIVVEVFGY